MSLQCEAAVHVFREGEYRCCCGLFDRILPGDGVRVEPLAASDADRVYPGPPTPLDVREAQEVEVDLWGTEEQRAAQFEDQLRSQGFLPLTPIVGEESLQMSRVGDPTDWDVSGISDWFTFHCECGSATVAHYEAAELVGKLEVPCSACGKVVGTIDGSESVEPLVVDESRPST